jgi:3-oxoacyl-[acyl-carrier-protein] synthase-3
MSDARTSPAPDSPVTTASPRTPRARIAGTGKYVPAQIRTNADLERMVDTSDAWIVERTGIRERRVAAEGEFTSDMAAEAARRALDAAGVQAAELDLIIVCTVTPTALDSIWPRPAPVFSTECRLRINSCRRAPRVMCSSWASSCSPASSIGPIAGPAFSSAMVRARWS